MKKKLVSLIVTTGMMMGIGVVGASSAQAESRPTVSNSFIGPIVSKPSFVPPTEGGGSSAASSNPSNGSAGRQFCYAVRVVTGFTTLWLIFGTVAKSVQVAVYGTEWICTMVYG